MLRGLLGRHFTDKRPVSVLNSYGRLCSYLLPGVFSAFPQKHGPLKE
jgi:hypothetical protein